MKEVQLVGGDELGLLVPAEPSDDGVVVPQGRRTAACRRGNRTRGRSQRLVKVIVQCVALDDGWTSFSENHKFYFILVVEGSLF